MKFTINKQGARSLQAAASRLKTGQQRGALVARSRAVLRGKPLEWWRLLSRRGTLALQDESGMSTVEYAIGTVAAAAFGALLYTVVTGDSVSDALTSIVDQALSTPV